MNLPEIREWQLRACLWDVASGRNSQTCQNCCAGFILSDACGHFFFLCPDHTSS